MRTFQDLEAVQNDPAAKTAFVQSFIAEHVTSAPVRTAEKADKYDRQINTGVDDFLDALADIDYKLNGITKRARPETVKSNSFHRLNVQRVAYSLANGITLPDADEVKAQLGESFDEQLYRLGYLACIHGESFGFWNNDHLDVFKLTEFAPLYDEQDGTMRAGIRFWRLQPDKPMHAVLYEESGYTRYTEDSKGERLLHQDGEQQPYKTTTTTTPAGDEIVEGEGYGTLPIVPLWGSSAKQSTLVNLKGYIDNTDLIVNGFCDDLRECAQVYWLISNYGGMNDADLRKFMQRLRFNHAANVDNAGNNGGSVQPYTQEIPTQARETLLQRLHSSLYEDFGGLDVHCVSANSTNDHLEAAYQPLDENARDFEQQVTKFVRQVLKIAGLPDAKPQYTHVRISNTKEQVDMAIAEATIIGNEMAIELLPNLTPEQKEQAKAALMGDRGRWRGGRRWQYVRLTKSLWKSSSRKRPRTTVTHHPAFTQLSGTGPARSTASTRPKLCARFTPAAIMRISTTRRVPLFWTTHPFQSCPESADSISIVAFRSSYSLHL